LSTTVEIPQLRDDEFFFPDPNKAIDDGILAWGGDLTPKRLIKAYEEGIFPWYSQNDPILWWSPNPRCILYPQDFHITKSLRKSRKKFQIIFNEAFEKVIFTCKDTREETWIDQEMIEAYINLHNLGIAKSVEIYKNEELVGGLYGVLIGSIFCGESMFSLCSDASKVALWALCEKMQENGGDFIDCQMPTEHLVSLGAKSISRKKFLKKLSLCKENKITLF
jgi:leucyl/phenylalanyl-tRNA---protein transferase